MKSRIQTRLMLGATVGVLSTVAVVGYVSYYIARNSLKDHISDHLQTVAQSRAAHVKTFLDGYKENIRIAASSTSLADGLRALRAGAPDRAAIVAQLNARLGRLVPAESCIDEIFLLDRDGKVVASTIADQIGLDRSADAYFVEAQSRPFIKDAFRSASTGMEFFATSAPLLDDAGGDLLGVLVARHHMVQVNAIAMDRTGLGETGLAYLVNKQGLIITPSRSGEDASQKLKVDTELVRQCLADLDAMRRGKLSEEHKERATVTRDYRGVRVLGAHAYVPELGWFLIAEMDASEAFAPIARLKAMTALIATLVALGAMALSYRFARRVCDPVHQLHRGSQRIAAGELDYRVHVKTGDEIEELAEEFNRMADKLSESHACLEQKVADRTADLRREIEERKRAEEALAQAASRWQETFDAVDDMIAVVDTDFRVLRANRAMREAFAGKEVVGAHCYELFHGMGMPPSGCPSRNTFASAEPAHAELREPHLGGRWLGVAAYPVTDKDGAVRHLVHVVHDITERKVAEERLHDYAKRLELLNADLERSNSDLQEFTHSVSHDLQEPLRKIHAFGQFLVEDCGEDIPDEGRKHLERIQDATVRMKRLIQHLLALARVGSRGAEIVPVDSRSVLEQAVDVLSERVAECDAQISMADGLPVVMADAVQLGQVFQNLIANALKFRSPDRRPRVTIEAEVAGGLATFSVRDNGIGIEERFLEKIFGVFQRLHLREEYDGAGVGLALCRKIVQRHGGRIWAESEAGEGSTFHFTLPSATETEGAKL